MIEKEKISVKEQEFEVRKVEKSKLPMTYKKSINYGGFTYDLSMVEEYENIMQEQAEIAEVQAKYKDKKIDFKEVETAPAKDQNVEFWQGVKELKAILEAQRVLKQTNEISFAYFAYKKASGNVKNVFDYEGCKIEKDGKNFKILHDSQDRFDDNFLISGKEKLYIINNIDFTPSTLSKKFNEIQMQTLKNKIDKFNKFAETLIHQTEIDGQVYNRKQYNAAREFSKFEISQREKQAERQLV